MSIEVEKRLHNSRVRKSLRRTSVRFSEIDANTSTTVMSIVWSQLSWKMSTNSWLRWQDAALGLEMAGRCAERRSSLLIVRCSVVIKKLYSLVSVNVKFLANLREEVKKGQHAVKNVTCYPICWCRRKTSICSVFNLQLDNISLWK